MKIKRKAWLTLLLTLIFPMIISNYAFAVIQNYPADYTQCYMQYHAYQPDWFANWSDTPTSQGYRDTQTYYAKRIFAVTFNTSNDPRYTNMWGTYSTSQAGAHEGIDMVFGDKQPVYHWGSAGVVTVSNPSVGLVGVYDPSISTNGETIFYRHMNGVTLTVGQSVPHGMKLGTQGSLGNSTASHLHIGVEWGNTAIDSSDKGSDFTSQNPYYAMQLLGY